MCSRQLHQNSTKSMNLSTRNTSKELAMFRNAARMRADDLHSTLSHRRNPKRWGFRKCSSSTLTEASAPRAPWRRDGRPPVHER